MEDKRQEDQDMMNVLKVVKKIFLKLFSSIIWLFETSFKNSLLLVIIILISVGLSLGIFFSQKPFYKSEMFLSNTRLENNYCIGLINNLNLNIDEGRENIDLAKLLNLDVNDAKKIRDITYAPANMNIANRYADSSSVYLPFKVEVEIYDNAVLPKLQSSILRYLESNEYAQKLKEIELQSINNTEARVLDEIKEIDSLKRIVNSSIIPRGAGNGIILGEPIDPVSIYDKSMKSYEKLMILNKQKKLNNSFDVIIGFNENSKKQGMSLIGFLVNGIIVGYLIGLIFLISRKLKSR